MNTIDTPTPIRLVDVAAQARDLYGADHAAELFPDLPQHDYRFEATTPTGGSVTFGRSSTAAYIAGYFQREGVELAVQPSTASASGGGISPVDLSMLIGRHTPVQPDPCRVCSSTDMTIGSMGAGNATVYRCGVATAALHTGTPDEQKAAEEHYRRSKQGITYHGDSEIVAALLELRTLREATGEDMSVPVGVPAFPYGHGKGRCYYRLRHEGGDRWVLDNDFSYSHDPTHETLEVD